MLNPRINNLRTDLGSLNKQLTKGDSSLDQADIQKQTNTVRQRASELGITTNHQSKIGDDTLIVDSSNNVIKSDNKTNKATNSQIQIDSGIEEVKFEGSQSPNKGTKLDDAKELIANYIVENPELSSILDNLENTKISSFDAKAVTGQNILARVKNLGSDKQEVQLDKKLLEEAPAEVVAALLIHELAHVDLHDPKDGALEGKTNSIQEEIKAYDIQFDFWGEEGYKSADPDNKYVSLLNEQFVDYHLTDKLGEFVRPRYGDHFPENPQDMGDPDGGAVETFQDTKFTEQYKADFNNVWDKNKDGSLGGKEMASFGWNKGAWNEHVSKNDADKDGKLNFDELLNVWEQFDTDKDGVLGGDLNTGEMSQYWAGNYEDPSDSAQDIKFKEQYKVNFNNVWDKNKDGSLDGKEMASFGWNKGAWNEHVSKNDADKDGKLNFDELLNVWEQFDTDKDGVLGGDLNTGEMSQYWAGNYEAIESNNSKSFPSDKAVQDLLNEYANSAGKNYPISIALINGDQTKYYSVGDTDLNTKNGVQAPTEDTTFSIGSVSKTLTATLLADMVERGEVDLDDPVQQYLPPGVELPKYNGKEITLEDLATHTSGLRDPATNPTDSKDVDDLFSFVESTTLASEPGKEYKYSNYGYGLLEEALAFAHTQESGEEYIPETTFENLLNDRVLDPLGLDTTKITLSSSESANLAKGFNQGKIAGVTDTFVGSGGIHSTTEDLVKFLQANMQAKDKAEQGLELSPIESALLLAQEVQKNSITGGEVGSSEIGLGWYLNDGHILKLGSIPGTSTYVNFSNNDNTGMVIIGGSSNFHPAELVEKLALLMNSSN